MAERVVVTGLGAVTPVGIGVEEFWQGLVAGRSGIDRLDWLVKAGYETQIGGYVAGFDPLQYMERKEARHTDRFVQMAVAAADMAVADAGLDFGHEDPERVGIVIGSGIGGIGTLSEQLAVLNEKGPARVSPFLIPSMIINMAPGYLAIRYGVKGPNTSTVSACASSANAIGEALRMLQRGDADLVICGGSEAPLVPIAYAGFISMQALSKCNDDPRRASRPFDRNRDGFVMAEGAGMLVLETLTHARARGARIRAEMAGYGLTADAYHMVHPDPEGDGGARAMALAMADAGLSPADVDYINAHGTSTPLNDKIETMAVKRVFGEHARRVAISSTKSMTGHLLGAAGAVELIATVLAVERGVIPPTINYEEPDPECDLDYVPNTARQAAVRAALSNSFGFGGQNVCLAVRGYSG